eukprot:4885754-Amphidinium_carterae.1
MSVSIKSHKEQRHQFPAGCHWPVAAPSNFSPSPKEVGPVLGPRKMAKWWGMVPSPNGRLYALPYDARKVLEIDPVRGGLARE